MSEQEKQGVAAAELIREFVEAKRESKLATTPVVDASLAGKPVRDSVKDRWIAALQREHDAELALEAFATQKGTN